MITYWYYDQLLNYCKKVNNKVVEEKIFVQKVNIWCWKKFHYKKKSGSNGVNFLK